MILVHNQTGIEVAKAMMQLVGFKRQTNDDSLAQQA